MLRASPVIPLTVLALGVTACPPPGPNPPNGPAPTASAAPAAAWKPKGFTRAAEGCTQAWACDCSAVQATSGCHLEATRDATTTGVCVADSGPPTGHDGGDPQTPGPAGCTRCMALPPPAACACNDVCP